MRATRQASNLLERTRRDGFIAFLKNKCRYAQNSEFTCQLAQFIHALFHAITDEDHRIDFACVPLGNGMPQNFGDLRLPPQAENSRHLLHELAGVAQPIRRSKFSEAPVVGHLNIKATNRRCFLKHMSLDLTRPIPGRFSAGCRVECEYQTPSLTCGRRCRRQRHLLDEGVDFSIRSGSRYRSGFLAHT